MKLIKGKSGFMLLALFFAIAAFVLFKFWLTDEGVPVFAGNIAAAFFGSLITIAITAVLLKQQTEIETKKEFNLKITETKIDLYIKLMDDIERVITSEDVSRDDAIKILILNRKIALVASTEVLKVLNGLTGHFAKVASDRRIDATEKKILMKELGKASYAIRKDILSESDIDYMEFEKLMDAGIEAMDGVSGPVLLESERESYNRILELLDKENIQWTQRSKGYSIQDSEGKSIVHIFPEITRKNSAILTRQLSEDKKNVLQQHLGKLGGQHERFNANKPIIIPRGIDPEVLVKVIKALI